MSFGLNNGVRQRRVDNPVNKEPVNEITVNKPELNEDLIDRIIYLVVIIIGFVLMFIVSVSYSSYLKQLHENHLWFSNIKVIYFINRLNFFDETKFNV